MRQIHPPTISGNYPDRAFADRWMTFREKARIVEENPSVSVQWACTERRSTSQFILKSGTRSRQSTSKK
jgi:hypothetical protein